MVVSSLPVPVAIMPNNNLFSLLPDDDPADAKAPRDRKKEKEDKARARQEALKKANNANGAKSKQAREAEDLRSLAFGAPKAKGKNKNKKGKAGGAASTQEGAGDAKKAGSEDPVGRDDKSSGSADDKAKAKQEEEFKKWQEDDAKVRSHVIVWILMPLSFIDSFMYPFSSARPMTSARPCAEPPSSHCRRWRSRSPSWPSGTRSAGRPQGRTGWGWGWAPRRHPPRRAPSSSASALRAGQTRSPPRSTRQSFHSRNQ